MTTFKPVDSLITITEPDSAAAEAYRILRTNISLKDFDQKLKIINIISTNAQESKSTTALNLAYVYSQLGKKTLVIDLDLRAPSLHKKLKIKNKYGISDVVSKNVSFSEAVIHYASKMDILLSGTRNPFASEFIQSKSFRSLLEALRQAYDMVIIDCPPVGLVTDGVIASTLCDGTIICVASGFNDRKDLERTRDLLKQFDVNILGVVMTRVPVAKRYYGHYGRYGRYGNYGGYGYGYTSSKKKTKKSRMNKKEESSSKRS